MSSIAHRRGGAAGGERYSPRRPGRAGPVLLATLLLSSALVVAAGGPADALLPSIQLTPARGEVGSLVEVRGSGFLLSTGGTVLFGSTQVGTFTSDIWGNILVTVRVPSVTEGAYEIKATTGTLEAKATFTVVSPTPVLYGVSTPSGPNNLGELDQFERDAGKKVALLMWYEGWAYDEFSAARLRPVADRGVTPVITWEPWDYSLGLNQPAYSLAKIIDGTHDAYIQRWANGAKAYGGTIFVRFAHEMNAKYYPWSEGVNGNYTAGQYISAWKHVVGIFRSVGATNVKFVWNPNISYYGTTPLNQLYPGDDWVDWVALDGYNGGSELPWGGFVSFADLFRDTLAELAKITTSKPIMIGETASAEGGGSKPDWIRGKFAELATRPQIKAFVWFNHQKEADWRIQSSEGSRQSFATEVSSPKYPAGTPRRRLSDYDGDGDTDVAVFRPSVGVWFIRGGNPFQIYWGTSGDIPVPGDYDGNGTTDVAVFRPSTGSWFVRGGNPEQVFWGTNGDIPLSLPPAVRTSFF